jgi:DNA replication and repair protein RecF
MKISALKLTNFRNWEERSFEFSDRVLIYGPNAQGKTNILEALYLLATTRSFRGREAELIKKNTDFLRLFGKIENERDSEIEITFQKNSSKIEKTFQINGQKRPTIDFVGEFSAIVFSPEDLQLVSGPPELKRRYLSFTIGQKDREYLYDLLNYKKVLKQRNDLLKRWDLGTIREEIDIWDQKLAEYGQKVIDKRKALEEFINKRIKNYYQNLSGEEIEVSFVYEPSLVSENLGQSLVANRERDIRDKITSVGPHRDSWILEVGGVDAAGICSRGEYRTLILALKLCERDWFLSKSADNPVILLDDVFSELDESRRKYLVEAFSGSQLIITTTDLEHLDGEFLTGTQLVNINNQDLRLFDKEKVENKAEIE